MVVAGAVGSGPGMGRLIHYDHRSGQERMISVWPEGYGMGVAPAEHRYRFQWTFPLFYSRWDPRELWTAGNRIFRSLDEGHTWEVVSPDLTRNDPAKLGLSGGPITRDNTAPRSAAGSSAGGVAARTWRAVGGRRRRAGAPLGGRAALAAAAAPERREWTLVSVLEPSPHDAATCYVAATRYKLDDPRPHLFKTHRSRSTWRRITEGIPDGEITRVNPGGPEPCPGCSTAGTETGRVGVPSTAAALAAPCARICRSPRSTT